ncbi:MAG: efflux RND transporter periplasmic adaptor subunit [Spirochaetaceae bacterium]
MNTDARTVGSTRTRAGERIPTRRALLRAAMITVALVLMLTGCSSGGGTAAAQRGGGGSGGGPGGGRPGGAADTEAPAETAVAAVETRNRTVQVGGRLRPSARITHEAPVGGIVRNVAVEPGDRVDAGAVLFTVERDEVGQSFRPSPVEARINGVVSEVMVQAEEQVRAGDGGTVVVGRGGYVLDARVSDKDIADVRVGQSVSARASDGTTVTGRLSVRGQEPDYETGLFPVTFRFPDAPGVGIGTFLLVELPVQEIEGIFVPRSAVDRRYGRDFVWAVDESEDVLVRREVELGEVLGDEVRIISGLSSGDRYLARLTGAEREGAPLPSAPEDGAGGGSGGGGGGAD